MKLKKLLALVLAVIMCASLFTVVPTTVSAASESAWTNFKDDGSRLSVTDGVVVPEGYERIKITSNEKNFQVTKEKYDLTETTFVLRDLYIGSTDGAKRGIVVFSNEKSANTKSKSTEGRLSLLVRDTGSGIKFTIYNDSGSETGLGTIPYADEYEIGFVKIWSSSNKYIYRIRLNNKIYETTEVTNFCGSSTGSYIGISSNIEFTASYKFFNNDDTRSRWVSTKGNIVKASDGSVENSVLATSLKADSNHIVASLSSYNMLEDIFVIKDLKMASTDTNWGLMVFSTNRDSSINPTVGNSITSDTKIKFFVKPYLEDTDGDGVKEMTNIRVSLSLNIAKDVLVPVADEYKFSFRYVDGKYRLFINEVQIGKDTSNTDYVKTFISAVNDFCENGNAEKCYISLKADGSAFIAGDFTVIKNPKFIDDSTWKTLYPLYKDGVRAEVPADDTAAPEGYERIAVNSSDKSTLVTKEKYDLTETTFVLTDLYFSKTGSDWVNIVFANDQTTGKRQTKTDAANGTLSMFVRKRSDGIEFSVYTNAGGEISLGKFTSANEYEIGFVKIYTDKGEYRWRLRVNNVYSSTTTTSEIYTIVNTFGPNSTGSYISISANSNIESFRASCKFFNNDDTNSRWVARGGKLYTADNVAVTDNAATSLRAKDGNSISSLSRYNMLENTFSVSNAVVSTTNYDNNGYRTKIVFSKYREDNYNVSSNNCMSTADKIQILLRPYVEVIDGKNVTTYLKVSLSTNIENDAMVPVASEYRFRFRLVDGAYQMYINDTRLTYTGSDVKYFTTFANAVNNFCTTGSGTNCYITVSTNTSFIGDYKVTENSEFIAEVDQPMYRCLDFEDYTIGYDGGAVINGVEYDNGAALDVAGNYEIIYPEHGIRYKRTLALYRLGDLDADNKINVLDFIFMTKAVGGNAELSAAGEKAADVTQDKKLQADDLIALRKKILGTDDIYGANNSNTGISAEYPTNNQVVMVANDKIYYWAQNYTIRSSVSYYGSGKIFQCKPVTFKWASNDNPTGYVLKISTSKPFENAIVIETTSNSAEVNSLFAGTTYYWQVTAKCNDGDVVSDTFTFKTAISPRTINLDGVDNTRDIGGYMTESGKRVKQGMVYRTASLDKITEAGKSAALNDYKIKTDIDLRAVGDGTAGTGSPIGDSINYIQISGSYYISSSTGINAEDRWPNIANTIKAFAEPANYPIAIHCSMGRDRTGTMCLLINGLLGVSKEDLFMDYELSYFSEIGCSDEVGANGMVDMFERTYNWLATYGGEDDRPFSEHVEAYMLDIGVTTDEIAAIRANMLEQ